MPKIFLMRLGIVYDEFHEIGKEAQGPIDQLLNLRAHFYWGLTATPPTGSCRAVVELASLLSIDLLGISQGQYNFFDCVHR